MRFLFRFSPDRVNYSRVEGNLAASSKEWFRQRAYWARCLSFPCNRVLGNHIGQLVKLGILLFVGTTLGNWQLICYSGASLFKERFWSSTKAQPKEMSIKNRVYNQILPHLIESVWSSLNTNVYHIGDYNPTRSIQLGTRRSGENVDNHYNRRPGEKSARFNV